MKREFLGDSYDAVKRMWQQMLSIWAPLYAEPRFVPQELRQDFIKLTGIPMLSDARPDFYSILNDPDTGVRLPNEQNQKMGRTHVTVAFIANQLRTERSRCVITFDQTVHRKHDLKLKDQLNAKVLRLAEEGFPSFYYLSHAPFLFAAPDAEALKELKKILTGAGIPKERLEKAQ